MVMLPPTPFGGLDFVTDFVKDFVKDFVRDMTSYTRPTTRLLTQAEAQLEAAFNGFLTGCAGFAGYGGYRGQGLSKAQILRIFNFAFHTHCGMEVNLSNRDGKLLPTLDGNRTRYYFELLLASGYKVGDVKEVLGRLESACNSASVPLTSLHDILALRVQHQKKVAEDFATILQGAVAEIEKKSDRPQDLPMRNHYKGVLQTIEQHTEDADKLLALVKEANEAQNKLTVELAKLDPKKSTPLAQAVQEARNKSGALLIALAASLSTAGKIKQAQEELGKGLKDVGNLVPAAATAVAAAGVGQGTTPLAAVRGGRAAVQSAGGRTGRTAFARASHSLAVMGLAGDIKMLALLDALDVNMDQRQRMQVSNAYAKCLHSGQCSPFRDEVRSSMGGRAVRTLAAARLVEPDPHDPDSDSDGDSDSDSAGDSGSGSGSSSGIGGSVGSSDDDHDDHDDHESSAAGGRYARCGDEPWVGSSP
jgi:hypothetical protein